MQRGVAMAFVVLGLLAAILLTSRRERCKNGGFGCPSRDVPQPFLEAWAECGTLRSGGFGSVIELGAERARELRMAKGGWGGATTYSAGLCPDDD